MSPEQAVLGEWKAAGATQATVTFTSDKKWTGSTQMGPVPVPLKGTWSVSDKVLTMKFESINNQPIADFIKMAESVGKAAATKDKELDKVISTFKAGARMTISDDMKSMIEEGDPTNKLIKVESKS